MASESSKSFARNWFGVTVEYQSFGRTSAAWEFVKEMVLGIVTFGITWSDYDPKRRCQLVIFRRDTSDQLIMFNYERLGIADYHLKDLRNRLDVLNVYDFCRQVGIDPGLVMGPGNEFPQNPDTYWRIQRGPNSK